MNNSSIGLNCSLVRKYFLGIEYKEEMSVTTAADKFIFPVAAEISGSASRTVSISVLEKESVTVTGISAEFTYDLSDNAACYNFLRAWNVKNNDVDGKADVSVNYVGDISGVVVPALQQATESGGKTLLQWVRDRIPEIASYVNFPDLLEAIVTNNSISLNHADGAKNLHDELSKSTNADARKLLFTQIPTSTVEKYQSDLSGQLGDNGKDLDLLPLKKGDTLTFIFNVSMTVQTSSVVNGPTNNPVNPADSVYGNTGSSRTTDYPAGTESKLSNYSTKKIALNIKLSGTAGVANETFTSA